MNKDLKENSVVKSEISPTDGKPKLSAVSWYKSLTSNQKIALKEISELICGMRWEDFNLLFTPRERIEILHNKLMMEGFDV